MPLDITLSDFTLVSSPRHERLPAYRFTVTCALEAQQVSWIGNLLVYDPAAGTLRVQPPRAQYGNRPYTVRFSPSVHAEIEEAATTSEFGVKLREVCEEQIRTLTIAATTPVAKPRPAVPTPVRTDWLI